MLDLLIFKYYVQCKPATSIKQFSSAQGDGGCEKFHLTGHQLSTSSSCLDSTCRVTGDEGNEPATAANMEGVDGIGKTSGRFQQRTTEEHDEGV